MSFPYGPMTGKNIYSLALQTPSSDKNKLPCVIVHKIGCYKCVHWTNKNVTFNDYVDRKPIWWEKGKVTGKNNRNS